MNSWNPFNYEPAAVGAVVRGAFYAAILLGFLHWTPDQLVAVMVVVEGVLFLPTRRSSTSVSTLHEAGTTPAKVQEAADDNNMRMIATKIDPTQ